MVTTRSRLVIQTYWFVKILYLNIQQSYILLLLSPTTVIIRTFLQHRLLRRFKNSSWKLELCYYCYWYSFYIEFSNSHPLFIPGIFYNCHLNRYKPNVGFWFIIIFFPETISKIWKISIARKEWETSCEIIKSQTIEEQDGVLNV